MLVFSWFAHMQLNGQKIETMNQFIKLFCLFLFNPISLVNGQESGLVRNTTLGQVKGHILTTRLGAEYIAFKGIPYGRADRFEAATLTDPWNEIYEASTYGPVCPQYSAETNGFIGQEDCLTMNIFVPQEGRCGAEPALLPTLFHIHGGAFTEGTGGGLYHMNYLLDECIVVVSINFRLGAFGFLATSDGILEGNLGLKDALLALRYFRGFAENFQSDKNLITLFGQSSGAASVSHFVVSPAARGLFSRAISNSGSCLSSWAVIPNPTENAEKLGNFLNCSFTSTTELRSCLKWATIEQILMYQESSVDAIFVPRWLIQKFSVGPVIEPETSSDPNFEPFITKHPYQRLITGDFNQIPIISGHTADEGILLQAGALMQNPLAVAEMNTKWRETAPKSMQYDHYNFTMDELNEISDKIRQFYFGEDEIGPSNFQQLIDMHSDRTFVQGILEYNQLHAKYAPVYPYVMTYVGDYSLASLMLGLNYTVVSHGHDTPYYLWREGVPEFEAGSISHQLSVDIVKMWANFARTGEPGDTWTEGIDWTQPSDRVTFKIDVPADNLVDYLKPRKLFWEQVGIYETQFHKKSCTKGLLNF